jgi:hypothetical protein
MGVKLFPVVPVDFGIASAVVLPGGSDTVSQLLLLVGAIMAFAAFCCAVGALYLFTRSR